MKLPRHVHKKTAKGRTYYYFDMGRDGSGRILKRLPDIRDHKFAAALQAAKSLRTKQAEKSGAKSFDWLVRLYERSAEWRMLKDNSRKLYSRYLQVANENFRNQQGRSAPLAILTAEQVIGLRDKYAETPSKANAIVRAVGAAYAWAMKPGRKYVRENIAAGVDLLEEGEHEAWPKWLVEAALDDPAIRLPVALLYFTGQRIGDVVRMGPQNAVRGVVSVTQQKTRKALSIAVHQRLIEILELDAPKGAMVFLLSERGSPATDSGIRQRIQKWAKDKHGVHVVPHGLRRNAVNALLEAGCSTAEVAAITGQSLQMIEHYAKERDGLELSRSAILKFEARGKGQSHERG